MTTTTNPGWRIQLAIHRAVRRDVARLVVALGDVDGRSPEALRAYWAETAAQLHHHHEFEDAVVWPLMGERLGEKVTTLLARNAHEHEVMAAAMSEFDTVLATTVDAPAVAALAKLREAIEGHLVHEEADVLPLVDEAFTMEDIAYFQAEDAKTMAPNVFLPWMLDDAPDEDISFFTAKMPAPVFESLESSWMPQRRLLVEAIGPNASVLSPS